jgi:hypothetical protein
MDTPYRHALNRIHVEYIEMPGIRLTEDQAQRLCGVDASVCRVVLEDLVRAGFLYQGPDGSYLRVVRSEPTWFPAATAART